MVAKEYITLENLEVYKLARELSRLAWEIYEKLDWKDRKTMGDQFITATDSVGANIAEGYKRYHYLDKVKFYYNARASLSEACSHWLELLHERGKIDQKQLAALKVIERALSIKLSNFISVTKKARDGQVQSIS
jgi:four helix bundle protein